MIIFDLFEWKECFSLKFEVHEPRICKIPGVSQFKEQVNLIQIISNGKCNLGVISGISVCFLHPSYVLNDYTWCRGGGGGGGGGKNKTDDFWLYRPWVIDWVTMHPLCLRWHLHPHSIPNEGCLPDSFVGITVVAQCLFFDSHQASLCNDQCWVDVVSVQYLVSATAVRKLGECGVCLTVIACGCGFCLKTVIVWLQWVTAYMYMEPFSQSKVEFACVLHGWLGMP